MTKPFTDAQWKEYADKYGVIVAQEFFDCCDYSKPMAARQILTPATGDWPEEIRAWFKATFRQPVDRFICGMSWAYANHYSIDILKFERYLEREFGYPSRQDGSMRDFMVKTFGQAATDKFQSMLKS